jgi:ATP-dependent RNA helicase RhlE
MQFDELGLKPEILRAVSEQGYTQPTPVQQKAIPVVLAGQDIMASAQTGTGKTAAFTLPILEKLSTNHSGLARPRALILTPTRELAAQVHENLRAYGRHLNLRSVEIFGGVNINPQIGKLKRGVDVLIATPGRLMDHMQRGTVRLDGIEILVLDEADRMLDMGFRPAIERILKVLPKQRQTLLFSATFSKEITTLAHSYLKNPQRVETAPPNSTVEAIAQQVIKVDQKQKRAVLSWLIGSNNWRQVLVFTRTKHGANRLAKQLETDGLPSAAIHGNKSQGARTKALADFKKNRIRVLVATDIAARGLDIDQLPHVVNYDIPHVPEDYVHRIGRTGRAGRDGLAVSLVSGSEHSLFQDIRKLVKVEIPSEVVEGYEPTEPNANSAPKSQARRSRGRGGNGGNRSNNGKSAGSKHNPRTNSQRRPNQRRAA